MIIIGMSSAAVEAHVKHLLKVSNPADERTADWNDEVGLVCSHNLAFGEDIRASMHEMAAVAAGSRCHKFLYLAALSPDEAGGRELDDNEAEEAALELLDELGFGIYHQWFLMRHVKKGRKHFHLAANRVDPVTLTAVHLGWNYAKHEKVARSLERRFDILPVPGVFADRPRDNRGKFKGKRPDRRMRRHWEEQQEKRTAMPIADVEADLRWAWQHAATGNEFSALLRQRGYQLARGDKRDLVVVDYMGGVHSPARRLRVKVAELRERTRDLPIPALPDVAALRAQMNAADATEDAPAGHHAISPEREGRDNPSAPPRPSKDIQ